MAAALNVKRRAGARSVSSSLRTRSFTRRCGEAAPPRQARTARMDRTSSCSPGPATTRAEPTGASDPGRPPHRTTSVRSTTGIFGMQAGGGRGLWRLCARARAAATRPASLGVQARKLRPSCRRIKSRRAGRSRQPGLSKAPGGPDRPLEPVSSAGAVWTGSPGAAAADGLDASPPPLGPGAATRSSRVPMRGIPSLRLAAHACTARAHTPSRSAKICRRSAPDGPAPPSTRAVESGGLRLAGATEASLGNRR